MATNGNGFNWQQLLQYIGPALNMMAENSRNQRQANPKYAPSSEEGLMNQMKMNEYANANENARRESMAASAQYGYDPYQKAKADRAGQTMENYLKMANQFPTFQATPQVQQASNTMFGGNQSISTPWQSQTQAAMDSAVMKGPIERSEANKTALSEMSTKYESAKQMAEALGYTDEKQKNSVIAKIMGVDSTKPGELDADQYESLKIDIGKVIDNKGNIKQELITKLGAKDAADAKEKIAMLLTAKYGQKQAASIRAALGMKNQNADAALFNYIFQGSSPQQTL